jgi:hypothetical protein
MLKKMGLQVPASEIDGTSAQNAKGSCLSDALVSVGSTGRGGTGSFVSADGLIITNHHVALDAVRQTSTVEQDYLKNGFVARSRAEEVAGADYEVWITRSCEDVSEQLSDALSDPDPLTRANKVSEKRQEIARAAEVEKVRAAEEAPIYPMARKEAAARLVAAVAENGLSSPEKREGTSEEEKVGGGKYPSSTSSSLRCEVQEMWAGKTYSLFTYERLRDVRLVYVPPLSLGNFGGDKDNFEWPRHTADFTLLRAYVGPDGSAALPHPSNVPYSPKTFLQANPAGASSGDFVFLLGFPGHTMRYAPSSRLAFSDQFGVPGLLKDFGEKLAIIDKVLEEARAKDKAAEAAAAAAAVGAATTTTTTTTTSSSSSSSSNSSSSDSSTGSSNGSITTGSNNNGSASKARSAALKMASAKKSLSNEYKRSLGKQVMLRKLGLVEERRREESMLVDKEQALVSEAKSREEKATALELVQRVARGVKAGGLSPTQAIKSATAFEGGSGSGSSSGSGSTASATPSSPFSPTTPSSATVTTPTKNFPSTTPSSPFSPNITPSSSSSFSTFEPQAPLLLAGLESVYVKFASQSERSHGLHLLQGNSHGSALMAVASALHKGSLQAKELEKERKALVASLSQDYGGGSSSGGDGAGSGGGGAAVGSGASGDGGGSALLQAANAAQTAAAVASEGAVLLDKKVARRNRELPFLVKRLSKRLHDLHFPFEAALLRRVHDSFKGSPLRFELEALHRQQAVGDKGKEVHDGFPLDQLPAYASVLESKEVEEEEETTSAAAATTTTTPPFFAWGAKEVEAVLMGKLKLPYATDACCQLAALAHPFQEEHGNSNAALFSERNRLLAQLLELQQQVAEVEQQEQQLGQQQQQEGEKQVGQQQAEKKKAATAGEEADEDSMAAEPFYPDANGCLRLSAGFVEGYHASDAVHHLPSTSLQGLLHKHTESKLMRSLGASNSSGGGGGYGCGGSGGGGGQEIEAEDEVSDVYACPSRLVDACLHGLRTTTPSEEAADAAAGGGGEESVEEGGRGCVLMSAEAVRKTPVCLLYSTDTVGGNSGSPVLDANGRFVAINFDRQRHGLMNEFKWDKGMSRSIGVDVRYVLWLVGSYDNAPGLVAEMAGGERGPSPLLPEGGGAREEQGE